MSLPILDIGVKNKDGATPLHYSARKKQTAASRVIKILKRNLIDLYMFSFVVFRLLIAYIFILQETEELIKYLASEGKVNVKDNYGSTPLHFAAMRGNEIAAAALVTIARDRRKRKFE